jgi:glycosyltransferase involved in cell wall biosynthesis
MASILFVGHEASLTGAPYTQLYLMQWLRANTAHELDLILLRGGPLVAEFAKVSTVHVIERSVLSTSLGYRAIQKIRRTLSNPVRQILRRVSDKSPQLIFANASLSVDIGVLAKEMMRVPLLLHVHELDSTFFYLIAEDFAQKAKVVDFFIPCAQAVKTFYQEKFSISNDKMRVVYDYAGPRAADNSTADSVRKEFDIPITTPLVGAVGTLGWRKGSDWFLQVVKFFVEIGRNDVRFLWLGTDPNSREYKELVLDARRLGLSEQIVFVKARPDVKGFYEAFDVFLLTSREDPFPLVCMEAASQACPLICFEQGGGMPEFVRDDAGFVVPYGDTVAMAKKTIYLLDNVAECQKMGEIGRERALNNHTIESAGPQFYQIMQNIVELK